MKIRHFENFEQYENAEYLENVVDIVKDAKNTGADAFISCKKWQTAVKRFFESLKAESVFYDWHDSIKEACENGYFKDCSDEFYHWQVEWNEYGYYVELTLCNTYFN